MIGKEDDRSRFRHAAALQNRQQLAELVVDIGDVGEIGAPGAANLFARRVRRELVASDHQPLRVRILPFERNWRDDGIERLACGIEVEILRSRDIGVVRVGEAHRERPWAWVAATR